VLLTFFGVMAFKAMKIQMFPDIDLPMVTVTAALPGASPDQLEVEVARKIENALASLQGLKHLYTQVKEGSVIISAEFRLERDSNAALEDVRSAVSRICGELPREMNDPVINKVELSGKPILTYTIAAPDMSEEALSWYVDNNITRLLLGVKGVGAVNRVGGVTRQIRVEIDPARLLALNLSAAEISTRLRQIEQEAPGGRAGIGGMEQSVRTVATVQTAGQLAHMEISLPDGRHVRLYQVADVSDTIAERRSAALDDGKPVVGFEIVRSLGASDVEVADGVTKALDGLRKSHPEFTVKRVFDMVDKVYETYKGSMYRDGADRGCRDDERVVRQFRPGDVHRRVVHLHRAGAAVQGFPAAGHDPGRAGAVHTRRFPGAVPDPHHDFDAVDDRPDHADGHRDQELHPAGRIYNSVAPRARHGQGRSTARCMQQTGAPHRDDDPGDGSFRSPMAIVVIGGLITSTFLSLLVIPVVFTYVDDVIQWFAANVRKYREVQHVCNQ
jgi:multidrug efflux pump subunit AcrB